MPGRQPDHVDALTYLVVEPQWSDFSKDAQGRPVLTGAKVVKVTQKPPTKVAADALVTCLTLRIDASALLPLQPQAIVTIAPGQVDVIEVAATAPEGMGQ